jgi:hypothetical protein
MPNHLEIKEKERPNSRLNSTLRRKIKRNITRVTQLATIQIWLPAPLDAHATHGKLRERCLYKFNCLHPSYYTHDCAWPDVSRLVAPRLAFAALFSSLNYLRFLTFASRTNLSKIADMKPTFVHTVNPSHLQQPIPEHKIQDFMNNRRARVLVIVWFAFFFPEVSKDRTLRRFG